ncbi:MAG: SAF domain-containing protein [Microbacterium sp.]
MSDSVRPRPRAFWADLRFLLGVALIVVSVAGVWFVVAAARQTVPVFAAARTIVPGEAVDAADLRVVEVALGQLEEAYASPASLIPGAVATRTITAGELVPRDALGDADQARTTTVVLRSATEVPAVVDTGATVEVWAASLVEHDVYDTPRILVASATVVSVDRDDSLMGSAGTTVELVIARADVAATLAAMADGSSLSIVPTSAGSDAAAGATP